MDKVNLKGYLAEIHVGNTKGDFSYSILSQIAEKYYTCKECEDQVNVNEYPTKYSSV